MNRFASLLRFYLSLPPGRCAAGVITGLQVRALTVIARLMTVAYVARFGFLLRNGDGWRMRWSVRIVSYHGCIASSVGPSPANHWRRRKKKRKRIKGTVVNLIQASFLLRLLPGSFGYCICYRSHFFFLFRWVTLVFAP